MIIHNNNLLYSILFHFFRVIVREGKIRKYHYQNQYITIIQLGLMMILLVFIYQKQGDNNQFFTFVFFDKNLE